MMDKSDPTHTGPYMLFSLSQAASSALGVESKGAAEAPIPACILLLKPVSVPSAVIALGTWQPLAVLVLLEDRPLAPSNPIMTP